jgi:hypothetical protein
MITEHSGRGRGRTLGDGYKHCRETLMIRGLMTSRDVATRDPEKDSACNAHNLPHGSESRKGINITGGAEDPSHHRRIMESQKALKHCTREGSCGRNCGHPRPPTWCNRKAVLDGRGSPSPRSSNPRTRMRAYFRSFDPTHVNTVGNLPAFTVVHVQAPGVGLGSTQDPYGREI